MEKLSSLLRKDADSIWRKIFEHPFVVELYSGKLPIEKFKFYVKQDYNYLIGMMRTFSILASKADYEVARLALEIAYADATIEMENYIKLLKKLGMTLEEVLSVEPMPTNIAYMNFLITTCYIGTPIECLVATLPCFWSYAEIAKIHRDLLKDNPVDIYVEWASVYLSNEYRSLVSKLIDLVDKLWSGENYEKLKKLFITASRYEYMFWDASYREEAWPV